MYFSLNAKCKLAATTALITMVTAMPMAHAKCSKFIADNICDIMIAKEQRFIKTPPEPDPHPDYSRMIKSRVSPVINTRPTVQPNGSQILTRSEPKMTIMP
jgi:hypothetical protein